jgi:hypothetical protein
MLLILDKAKFGRIEWEGGKGSSKEHGSNWLKRNQTSSDDNQGSIIFASVQIR